MIQFKVIARKRLGGHTTLEIHTAEFARPWANCGTLIMTAYEADAFKAAFQYHEWEIAK